MRDGGSYLRRVRAKTGGNGELLSWVVTKSRVKLRSDNFLIPFQRVLMLAQFLLQIKHFRSVFKIARVYGLPVCHWFPLRTT